MRKDGSRLRFSPSDLINFMGSEFVTWMDRFYKECPGAIEPDADTEEDKIIQDKGLEHERAFLGRLAAQGRRLCDLSGQPGPPGLYSGGHAPRRGDHLPGVPGV